MRVRGLILLFALTIASRAVAAPPEFRTQIAPLIVEHCLKCHSGDQPKGDLDLTKRETMLRVIEVGKPDKSHLIEQVAEGKMPPKKPLTKEQVSLLREWIASGAKWDGDKKLQAPTTGTRRVGREWWSLQPIQLPVPPLDSSVRTPIDAFVRMKLREQGLDLSPEADRRTLIIRVTLDLTGLRPTPEQIDVFMNDRSPDAYEKVVDRLLASPQYGERWARHWLDVVRFAESHGYEMNTLRPNAWTYRDYVIRSLNRDVPFDQFVMEQLAADTIANADPLTRSATGFIVGGPHDLVGNSTEEGTRQKRADELADMVSTTSQVFLGLTVGCARCHDHKFDPIAQRDFYSMEAIFAGVDHAEVPFKNSPNGESKLEHDRLTKQLQSLEQSIDAAEPIASPMNKPVRRGVQPTHNIERFAPINAKFIRFTIDATTDGSQPCVDEVEVFAVGEQRNVALLEGGAKVTASSEFPNNPIHKIRHIIDGQFGNGKSWISNEPGKGWFRIELPRIERIDRILWARDREGKYPDRLPKDYKIEVSLNGQDWQSIAGSWDRHAPGQGPSADPGLISKRDELRKRIAELNKPTMLYAGQFRSPEVSYLLSRGDVMQRGEVIPPAPISTIGVEWKLAKDAPEPERRRSLAAWITDTKNPLAARVMVNRLWHWHFGQGIVRTPSDFGSMGDRPSHPELLDWLASEFLANGGRMKPLHRLIVLSSTYRQASVQQATGMAKDAGNRWLWRYPPHRLEAEAVRDTMLQTSGSLVLSPGGPGYHLWNYSGYVIVYTPKSKLGPDEFRRMVYQFKPRLQQDTTFGAFDCPDATTAISRRGVSTTALQALNLLNSEFVQDQAERFAERLKLDVGEDPVLVVRQAFRLAFGREPRDVERDAAVKLIRDHGVVALCRVLFNANEFIFVD